MWMPLCLLPEVENWKSVADLSPNEEGREAHDAYDSSVTVQWFNEKTIGLYTAICNPTDMTIIETTAQTRKRHKPSNEMPVLEAWKTNSAHSPQIAHKSVCTSVMHSKR